MKPAMRTANSPWPSTEPDQIVTASPNQDKGLADEMFKGQVQIIQHPSNQDIIDQVVEEHDQSLEETEPDQEVDYKQKYDQSKIQIQSLKELVQNLQENMIGDVADCGHMGLMRDSSVQLLDSNIDELTEQEQWFEAKQQEQGHKNQQATKVEQHKYIKQIDSLNYKLDVSRQENSNLRNKINRFKQTATIQTNAMRKMAKGNGTVAAEEKQYQIQVLHNDLSHSHQNFRQLASELKMAESVIDKLTKENSDLRNKIEKQKDQFAIKKKRRSRNVSMMENKMSRSPPKANKLESEQLSLKLDKLDYDRVILPKSTKRATSTLASYTRSSAPDNDRHAENALTPFSSKPQSNHPVGQDQSTLENIQLQKRLQEKDKEIKLMGLRLRELTYKQSGRNSPKLNIGLLQRLEGTYDPRSSKQMRFKFKTHEHLQINKKIIKKGRDKTEATFAPELQKLRLKIAQQREEKVEEDMREQGSIDDKSM